MKYKNLLQAFSAQKTFAQNLLEAVLSLLPSLSATDTITQVGLDGLFALLTWCQVLEPGKVFTSLLGELHSIANKVASIRAPQYNILRTSIQNPRTCTRT